MRNNETNKVLFVSLGCDKNLVDSEEMLGALQQRGFVFTDEYLLFYHGCPEREH